MSERADAYTSSSPILKAAAPQILQIIKESQRILLHCHPAPDPDSVGSALAMKYALEELGKKVTIIRGDSAIPDAFSHFQGFANIIPKNYLEIMDDVKNKKIEPFDLFIIQDTATLNRVSRLGEMTIPQGMKTVVIDHHISNIGFGNTFNLVDPFYPATALILFDLFKLWNITITPEIAANLFIGSYTDTGGFKYSSVTSPVFSAAAELARIYPNFHKLISTMENTRRPVELTFEGLALLNIETFLEGRVAISTVSYEDLQKYAILPQDTSSGMIANIVKSVVGWEIGACIVETEKNKGKTSFRTRDAEKYNLSEIAAALGGGGHRAAAAAIILGSPAEIKSKIVAAVETYESAHKSKL